MAKGQPPDERELRRLALAVRMYQEGRPHWELPAGERHSRVWEWVWYAAEWALRPTRLGRRHRAVWPQTGNLWS